MDMKTPPTVYVTMDYSMFELSPFNRKPEKYKGLLESMRVYGFDTRCPIACEKSKVNKGKLTIMLGQHRFLAAEALGLPVYYLVAEDEEAPIATLERGVKPWRAVDFVTAFAGEGRQAYMDVLKFHKDTGIPLARALSMFRGESASSGNATQYAKRGTMEIRNRVLPHVVADLAEHIEGCSAPWAKNSKSICALCLFVMLPQFDIPRMKQKATAHSHLLSNQNSNALMMDMYEAVYNRQVPQAEKIPIAFIARQAALSRRKAFNKRRK